MKSVNHQSELYLWWYIGWLPRLCRHQQLRFCPACRAEDWAFVYLGAPGYSLMPLVEQRCSDLLPAITQFRSCFSVTDACHQKVL